MAKTKKKFKNDESIIIYLGEFMTKNKGKSLHGCKADFVMLTLIKHQKSYGFLKSFFCYQRNHFF